MYGNPYFSDFGEMDYYESKNGYRMPSYHRLDLGCRFYWGEENSSVLSVSIYNIYSRKNPFFYFFGYDYENGDEILRLKQISLFPIIPSITYSFKF